MTVRIVTRNSLLGSSRYVVDTAYETVRFLLAEDGLALTLTDITLKPGIPATYGYDHHIEFAYCIEGRAELTDHATGITTAILPGTLWIAERGSRFDFLAGLPTRLICVFTPPFSGHETGFAGDQ